MNPFARGDNLPRIAIKKRSLSQPALCAGFALLLTSTAPAAADFFGTLDQPRIENSDTGPTPAVKAPPRREAKRHQRQTNQEQPLPQGPFQIVVAIARQQITLGGGSFSLHGFDDAVMDDTSSVYRTNNKDRKSPHLNARWNNRELQSLVFCPST